MHPLRPKIRLYVTDDLSKDHELSLSQPQCHYLINVMRKSVGDSIALFNGREGEWAAEIVNVIKKNITVICRYQSKVQETVPNLWLLFAPIKKTRTTFIIEKATELGVAQIQPIKTEFTNTERLRVDKMEAQAIEAAEQCSGTTLPIIHEMDSLDGILANWPSDRSLIFCDEALADKKIEHINNFLEPSAVLIGPEGGFSEKERKKLYAMKETQAIQLGSRILRADTACVAAISYWYLRAGIWT